MTKNMEYQITYEEETRYYDDGQEKVFVGIELDVWPEELVSPGSRNSWWEVKEDHESYWLVEVSSYASIEKARSVVADYISSAQNDRVDEIRAWEYGTDDDKATFVWKAQKNTESNPMDYPSLPIEF